MVVVTIKAVCCERVFELDLRALFSKREVFSRNSRGVGREGHRENRKRDV
jgi:hypothetical protein